ncbi:unnamed protein product [Owenia fusiformis]|uniref:Vesicle-associated membrane protein 7 n=1 Tax=Owenia fusiformis TaxID=6347 RepID=A0A8S4PL83_OWEFU|nr:unnamed protein product [Owenia fusiformis]
MTIVYSCIARGAVILCSHQIGSGSFESVASDMLRNIPTRSDTKTTYTSDNYLFHCIIENGLIYMCAADPNFGKRQPYGYLTEIKRRFQGGSLGERAQFALENELNRDFAQVMASNMEKFSNASGGGDAVSTLQKQVDDVKGVMTQNIEKVLDRGERLDDLLDKTTDLEANSATFRKTARRVHRKMWCANMKMNICIAVIAIIVILVITLIILFSTHTIEDTSYYTVIVMVLILIYGNLDP